MIDHVGIRVSDIKKSETFYEKALAPLGYKNLGEHDGAIGFAPQTVDDAGSFWIVDELPLTVNAHISFRVNDEKFVQDFYDAAMAAGGKDNGKPGSRPEYREGYYASFVLDPDGNNIEATFYKG